jgi:myo-inositol 2-dehydrogenase/D-chiro-inositol 1-dehydrogenase
VFRLGLIGAGRMGRTHLRALTDGSEVRIVSIAEPSEASRNAIANTDATLFDGVDAMLAAGGLDGVLIAAPTGLHPALVARVAEAGLPILCEKPCGFTVDDVRDAAASAERHGVALQIAYWRRYVPALQVLRERVARGEMGDVHLVASSQWDEAPPAAAFRATSGGIFIDMAVHEFDQVRWITGQEFGALDVVASPLRSDREATNDVDSASAIGTLSGGTTAFISVGRWHRGGDVVRLELFGTMASASETFIDQAREGDAPQMDALRRQAEGFAAFARGGPCTGATVDDAAAALEAAQRATAAVPGLGRVAAGSPA